MASFTDQCGRTINISKPPQRIISLVPSLTELLFDLGLDNEVAGITKFCVHPQEWFRNKTRVGGTKNVNIEKVKSLQPDLIIANKEENVKEQVELLETIAPVWISDINNVASALEMIENMGEITAATHQSTFIKKKIEENFSLLQVSNTKLKTAYLIWREPYMTVGGDTFIHDMMSKCGFENVFAGMTRYPAIELTELSSANCQLVLLSSEPYPFKEKHIDEIKKYLPDTAIILVNGEMFSWYGSRMLHAADYFKKLAIDIQTDHQV